MRNIGFAFLLALASWRCSFHEVEETIPPPIFLPSVHSETGSVATPDTWWRQFEDPQLNAYVEEALETNRDLRAAWARLKQFQATVMRDRRSPQLDVTADANRTSTFFQGRNFTGNTFGLQAAASYEVDLWRRLEALERIDFINMTASRADMETTALTLAASVTRTWYTIVAQREDLALLTSQIQTNRELLEIIEARFSNGAATAVEVYQQREQVRAIEAQVPPVRSTLAVQEHQLAVLLGRAPTDMTAEDRPALPQLADIPQTGIPVDLLEKRPDLRAAMDRIVAADYQLAVAIADQYPSLRLTGSAGYGSDELSDLFSNFIWNIFAGLTAPIIDGKQRRSEVARNRAVVEERLAQFEQNALIALQEIEDALIQERYQNELIESLDRQLTAAESALETGQARYLEGVGDFLTVLTELQAVQRIQRSIITARSQRINQRIALHQALGGDWVRDLDLAANVEGASGL